VSFSIESSFDLIKDRNDLQESWNEKEAYQTLHYMVFEIGKGLA
jgi:hypothetical protein